jgi:hypothetical protein
MAELAEEYSRLTKKILTHCIQAVIGIHVLLLVGLPHVPVHSARQQAHKS